MLGERHPDYAQSLNNLANLLYATGDYARARPLYEQALAITREALGERHPDYAQSLNNLAALLSATGDYARARPLYEQALAIRKKVLGERHPSYATSLNNLAWLLQAQGDYAAAKPLYEQALAIRKAVLGERHPDSAGSLNNLAVLLQAQGDYAAAKPLYEQALAIRKEALGERHPDYARSLNDLAVLLESQGDYAAARPLFERALAITREALGKRHPDYAIRLSNLAKLTWAQRDHAGAERLLEQAMEISQRNLDLAAAALSERQQLAMVQHLRGYIDLYLSLAPQAGIPPGEMYRHVLVAKGAVLQRQQGLRAQRRRLGADPHSEAARRLADYQLTMTRLATLALATPDDPKHARAWRDRVAELSRRKDAMEAELAGLDPSLRAERAEANRTPDQLRGTLPRGTALVDLLVFTASQPPPSGKGEFEGERRLVAFVARPDRPIVRVELGPIEPIANAIDAWRPIGRRADPAAGDAARAVRRLVWEPLEPHLEGITSVLISPDGPIGLVPLAALPGQVPGSYLIEERSIAIVPVPQMLGASAAFAPAQAEPAPSLLLVGDIDYGGPGAGVNYMRLPATLGEILAIRGSFEKSFPDSRAQMLRGDKATEEAFRRLAPRSRYLHLATHGYFAPPGLRSALGPGDPKTIRPGIDALGAAGYNPGLLSGIVLAGANRRPTPIGQDDGILTSLEVAELDLSGVELAVLSANDTGLGEVASGEGLLGLHAPSRSPGLARWSPAWGTSRTSPPAP